MVFLKAPQVPLEEFSFSASRSQGPGGQNVNKLNTRVTVTFNVETSPSLSDEQRDRIKAKLANRISKEGNIQVSAQSHRSQRRNREEALERMQLLLASAFVRRRKRRRTRPTQASIRKRLEAKKRRGELKKQRRKPSREM